MTLKRLNKAVSGKKERDVKILQFGEGNFLRAFADHMVDIANETGDFNGDIVIVKPTARGNLNVFREQECQYTVSLRGIIDNEAQIINRTVSCVTEALESSSDYDKYMEYAHLDSLRFVISNTTEAGIVYDKSDRFDMRPPATFPGKLTKFLYERYRYYEADESKGLIMLPVELIDDNGKELKDCVVLFSHQWNLDEGFTKWLDNACVFASTLVDRIVSGYPNNDINDLWEDIGYEDRLITAAEPFGLWVIDAPKEISQELPLNRAGLPVIFTDKIKKYKKRKVRILNGAHTSFVLASYLCGNNIVNESMNDAAIYGFMYQTLFEEVIPTLDMPLEELKEFAYSVITRFRNPYVNHELLAISLNSVSKWKTRCMPSLLDYVDMKGIIPSHLAFSLAALMIFYSGNEINNDVMYAYRNNELYHVKDDIAVLEYFMSKSKLNSNEFTNAVLSHKEFWEYDLLSVDGLCEAVAAYVEDIRNLGMRNTINKYFK